jgi:Chaperone of endosialidase
VQSSTFPGQQNAQYSMEGMNLTSHFTGRYVVGFTDGNTVDATTRIITMQDSTSTDLNQIAGVSQTTTASGAVGTVTLFGGTSAVHSALVPGSNMYVNSNGVVTSTVSSFLLGRALSATDIQLLGNNYLQAGNGTAATQQLWPLITDQSDNDTKVTVNDNGEDNDIIRFYNNGTQAGIFDSNARLGLNTTSPQRRLHVAETTNTPVARFEDANGYCEIDPTNTSLVCTSDVRLKKDYIQFQPGLEELLQLSPMAFHWGKQGSDEARKIGFGAQQVEGVLGGSFVTTTTDTGLKTINFNAFAPLLVKGVQDLNTKVDAQEQQIKKIALHVGMNLTELDQVKADFLAEIRAENNARFASMTADWEAMRAEYEASLLQFKQEVRDCNDETMPILPAEVTAFLPAGVTELNDEQLGALTDEQKLAYQTAVREATDVRNAAIARCLGEVNDAQTEAAGVEDSSSSSSQSSEIADLTPFYVDEDGVPLTGNAIVDACLRNQVTLRDDGTPYNCARYRGDGFTWTLETLSFEWQTNQTPPRLVLPDGYVRVVKPTALTSSVGSSAEASSASSADSSVTIEEPEMLPEPMQLFPEPETSSSSTSEGSSAVTGAEAATSLSSESSSSSTSDESSSSASTESVPEAIEEMSFGDRFYQGIEALLALLTPFDPASDSLLLAAN